MQYDQFKRRLGQLGYTVIEHPDQPWPGAVAEIRSAMRDFLALEAPDLLGLKVGAEVPDVPCFPGERRPRSLRLRVVGQGEPEGPCACRAMNREVSLGYTDDCVYYAQWATGCPDVPVQYAEVGFTPAGEFEFLLGGVGQADYTCHDASHTGRWDGSSPITFLNPCRACAPDGTITLTAVWD